MVDTDTAAAGNGTPRETERKGGMRAYIGYCDKMELYRYSVDLGEGKPEAERWKENRFTHKELINSMANLEEEGKLAEREYLALITAFARRQPHMKIGVDLAPGT